MKTMRLFWMGAVGLCAMAGFGQTTATPTSTLTTGGLQSGTTGQGAYYGYQAGKVSTGTSNAFFGNGSGVANTTGTGNACFGNSSGLALTTGGNNTFVGASAGSYSTTGSYNSFFGVGSGTGATTTGASNTCIGAYAGYTSTGSGNVYLGYQAGFATGSNGGSNNIFIGYNAGQYAGGNSNKLFIDNSTTSTPLIWGDFSTDQLKFHGAVGIGGNGTTAFGNFPTTAGGVSVSAYKLFVKGGILTEEIRVNVATGWADYVFAKHYNLKPLNEVEKFISDNGHLPNVPSAACVAEGGIELGQMAKIQQEKIEELTLYLIQQYKEIEALKSQVSAMLDKK